VESQQAAIRAGVPDELGIENTWRAPPLGSKWEEAWTLTEALLDEMHRVSEVAGAEFLVFPIPSPAQLNPDQRERERMARALGVDDLNYAERRLRDAGRRDGYVVVETADLMAQQATKHNEYMNGFPNTVPGRGHLNELGHATAADILFAALVSDRLVPMGDQIGFFRTFDDAASGLSDPSLR
jgi:hypothetical protein